MKKHRVVFLTTHPIQYQAPFLKLLSSSPDVDLTVLFCCRYGIEKRHDVGFDRDIKWDVPLLDRYRYKFLRNFSPAPKPTPLGQINLGIFSEISSKKYDVVIVHGWMCVTNLLVILWARSAGVKLILKGEADLIKKRSLVVRMLKKVLMTIIFKLPHAFLYTYSGNRSYFTNYGVSDDKLFFFPCAVDNSFFLKEKNRLEGSKDEIRSEIGIRNDDKIILFAGKFIDRKRPFDLINAFRRVNTEANLVLVGDGILRQALKEYVDEKGIRNVFFPGFKNQSEISEMYSIADLVVLPSEYDPSPKVLNEAMNFDIPLVVSEGVGTGPDLIQEGINGSIFKTGDVDSLAIAITKVLEGEMQGSLEAVSQWSFEKEVEGAIKALNSCLDD